LKNRINEEIKEREVRLVNLKNGHEDGVYPIEKALNMSNELGLDLIEISSKASPVVCKIEDYSKFKYEQEKKIKDQKKNAKKTVVKEVRFSPNIGDLDFQVKLKQVKKFLGKDNKVKIVVRFKGRQLAFKERGYEIISRVMDEIEDLGIPETKPNYANKKIDIMFKPKK
jgi:translation initiation factor IF-3